MILTDRVVYVHPAKTGGSFVASALYRIHETGARRRWLQRLRNVGRRDTSIVGKYGRLVDYRFKHGRCSIIPPDYAGKPILGTVRNPFDRYVSQYEFGWWKKKEMYHFVSQAKQFNRQFPNFPDLTFEEYIHMVNDIPRGFFVAPWHSEAGIGRQTREFIQYYFRDPPAMFEHITLRSDDPADFPPGAMYDVTLLRTGNLNADLHAALTEIGFDAEDIAFISEMRRVLPGGRGRSKEQAWQKYYTPELLRKVRQKEAVMLKMFPEFDPGDAGPSS